MDSNFILAPLIWMAAIATTWISFRKRRYSKENNDDTEFMREVYDRLIRIEERIGSLINTGNSDEIMDRLKSIEEKCDILQKSVHEVDTMVTVIQSKTEI